jgi:hypothetical protein
LVPFSKEDPTQTIGRRSLYEENRKHTAYTLGPLGWVRVVSPHSITVVDVTAETYTRHSAGGYFFDLFTAIEIDITNSLKTTGGMWNCAPSRTIMKGHGTLERTFNFDNL